MDSQVMDWTQFILFFIGVFGLFIWNRAESRTDVRHMDNKLESNRNLSIQIHQENRQILEAIREDIKEFHGRLCALEEKNKSH